MINKKLIIILLTTIIGLSFVLAPVTLAQLDKAFDISNEKSPLKQAADGAGYDTQQGEGQIDLVVGKVIRALLTFLGVIFMALMIYGGFLWMTDRGNEDQVKKAKNLITAAIIGLVIVVSAYAISVFVVGKLTSSALQVQVEKP